MIRESGHPILVSLNYNERNSIHLLIVIHVHVHVDKDALSLNVSNIGKGADSKQSVVLNAVKGLVMEFLDHLASFSSYLQQVRVHYCLRLIL